MASIDVHLDDRQSRYECHLERLATLLSASLDDQGVRSPAEVGLAMVSIDEMTELNEQYMQHTGAAGPTDVLAFPIDGLQGTGGDQPTMVGDIVICPEVASKVDRPLIDELALLTVHGALHLLGHDHYAPDEAAIMQSIQRDLLQRFHQPAASAESAT